MPKLTDLEFTAYWFSFPTMFFATANRAKRLLHISYIGNVGAEELRRGRDDVVALLAELPTGFKMLIDLERLESMDIACVEELGKMMDLFDQHGLQQVVRVIPDPAKDIGLNILARFHYQREPRITNCKTMIEAAALLSL
jgi:anti-anti-sigma regulatory factor